MDECIFCKIVNKQIKAEIIYEDAHALAFLDIMPRAPGHAVVIPKTHIANLTEFPDEEIGAFFGAVKKTVKMVGNGLDPDGFTLGVNHNEAAGQVIPHLHFHIIPRWRGDGGKGIQGVVNNPPQESLEQVAKKIRTTSLSS